MKRNGSITFLCLCAALYLWPTDPAAAANLVPKARIAAIEGEVSVKYQGTDDFVSVWRYDRVGAADEIRTGADGLVELLFGDGSLVRLGPGATLALEAVEPSRVADENGGGERVLVTVMGSLVGGRAHVAAGPGSKITLSTGFVSLATDQETGADFVFAADVFSTGYYLGVERGCVFVFLRDSGAVPVCGRARVKVGMFASDLSPLTGPDLSIGAGTLAFSEEPPSIVAREGTVRDVSINGAGTMESPDGRFSVSAKETGGEKPFTVKGTVDAGRAVLISIDDGTTWETIAPDADGRWEYEVRRPPAGGLSLLAKSIFIGPMPEGVETLGAAPPAPSPDTAPAVAKESADDIAARFVRGFVGALNRGDTTGLAALIAADYTGTAGGSSKAALLRSASDFFRGGKTLSVSATVGTSSRLGEAVIATMTFSSRTDATTKNGTMKLWITPNGTLSHAEGEWMF